MRTRTLSRILVVTCLLAMRSGADAKKPDAKPDPKVEAEARRLNDEGTRHFNLGEYDQSVVAYKEAYRLVGNAFFLLNIAQAYRLANDPKNALVFYKNFLNAKPEASNRAEIERRIVEMEGLIKALPPEKDPVEKDPVEKDPVEKDPTVKIPSPEEAAKAGQPTGPTLPEQRDTGGAPVYKKWWFWTGIAVVAAGTAATIVILSGGDDGIEPPGSDLGTHTISWP